VKVVGTGAPRMLTIRVEPCEVDVLCDELDNHRTVAVDAATRTRANPAASSAGAGDREVEDRDDELYLICRLLDELRAPSPAGQPREIVAPTWLLAPVIRGAAAFAAERLAHMISTFGAAQGSPTREELRAAIDAARACGDTLVGLDHAESHAVGT
jgi:hypothetical protein